MSEPPGQYRTRRTEHDEQAVVVQWAKLHAGRWQELDLLFAIPNGARLSGGARAANRLKAEGMRPGVPDLCLPVARSCYHGLFVEMKVGSNKPSDKQSDMLDALNREGYLALACWSAGEAIEAIEEYLEGAKPEWY